MLFRAMNTARACRTCSNDRLIDGEQQAKVTRNEEYKHREPHTIHAKW